MKWFVGFGFFSVFINCFVSEKVHFYGDKVFRIYTRTQEEFVFIDSWLKNTPIKIDVWKEPSAVGRDIDIHVSKDDVDEVKKVFTKAGLTFKCIIEDLEQKINEEQNSNHYFGFSGSYNYDAYNQYGDIVTELNNLANTFPNAKIFNVGKSFEKRDMVGIKLLTPEVIFSQDVQSVLLKYDFYFLPVFNVDGYEYTFTANRMWRKTRSPGIRGCEGADPNRNWDAHFGVAGTSNFQCSDIYPGSKPFSEVEVKQVANFLENLHRSQGIKSFWNVHAYSQLLLYPWSYTKQETVDDKEIKRVGDIFADGVRSATGMVFEVGQPSKILYPVGGGSIDWTYEKLSVKYSYAPELRPGRDRLNGFIVPAYQIKLSGREFTTGFLKACLAMK